MTYVLQMKEASVKDGKAMLLTDDVFRYRVDNNERAGQEMQEVEVSVMDVADHDDAQMTSSLRPQPSSQQQHLQGRLGLGQAHSSNTYNSS